MKLNNKASTICDILYKYENYLSDGYGYYCRSTYTDVDQLLNHIAKQILAVEQYDMSRRVRAIVRVLKTNEDHMSDGFGYYYYGFQGSGYKSELQLLIHIAEEIVRDVFKPIA